MARLNDEPGADINAEAPLPRTSPLAEIDPPSAASAGPRLRVESMGPRSIALNTAAAYTVAVHNDSDVDARDVAVTIRVPAWAEIVSSRSNSALSRRVAKTAAGGLKWDIERVDARDSMELTLQIVPRERRAFELAVDWTSAPEPTAVTSSRRQPRLPSRPTVPPALATEPAPKPESSEPSESAPAADAIAQQQPPLASPSLKPEPLPAAPLVVEDQSTVSDRQPAFDSPALADAPKSDSTPAAIEPPQTEAPALLDSPALKQELAADEPKRAELPLVVSPAREAANRLAATPEPIAERSLAASPAPSTIEPPLAVSPAPSIAEPPLAIAPVPATPAPPLAMSPAPERTEPPLALAPAPKAAEPLAAAPKAVEPRPLPAPLTSQPDRKLPKIELTISGPDEVRFGEEAVFTLTLTNTGEVDAEQVEVRLLPTADGGEPIAAHSIGTVRAGETQTAEIELIARDPGDLTIHAEAVAAGDHRFTGDKLVEVVSTDLKVEIAGPQTESLGSVAAYQIHVSNTGKASLENVKVTVALPTDASVVSVSGADKRLSSGPQRLVVALNKLTAEEERVIELNCTFDQAGEHKLQATAESAKLKHTGSVATNIQGAPDLVLDIVPPKGQIPLRAVAKYEIWIRNRGTGAAEGLQVVTFFSEGIEPISATGAGHQVGPGQVVFHRVPKINPGDELVLTVNAAAQDPGRHRFRAELHSKSPEVTLAEETTARFGDARPKVAEKPSRPARSTR